MALCPARDPAAVRRRSRHTREIHYAAGLGFARREFRFVHRRSGVRSPRVM